MGFGQSQRGGGSTTFGVQVTMAFLERNNLKVTLLMLSSWKAST
jgi:hypothetical protein